MLNLGTLGQISLTVDRLDAAVEFYRDVLGIPLLFQAPPSLAFFDCGGIRLMLSPPEADASPTKGGSTLYFRVSDIHTAHEALQAQGVKFQDTPHLIAKMTDHELWMAFFNDPAGNLLAIMAEHPLS